jgi:hypothetical protein
VTQDFRYLVYYVWSELPPPEKPADIVLIKGIPVVTPVEEIKRAADALRRQDHASRGLGLLRRGRHVCRRPGRCGRCSTVTCGRCSTVTHVLTGTRCRDPEQLLRLSAAG